MSGLFAPAIGGRDVVPVSAPWGVASRSCASSGRPARAPSLASPAFRGLFPPRNARLGRGGIGRVQRSGGRYRGARRAPRALWPRHGLVPSTWQRPGPLQASRRRPPAGPEAPPAPTSSRTHNQPGRATGASGGGSTYWPRPTARTRSRRRQRARSPSGGDDLYGARETPVAAFHPGRHPPARAARPDPAHAPRHRTALRRLQGPRRPAHADLGGRDDRQPTDPAPAKLLQQLRKHRQRGAFRGEEERRARLVAELQKARLTGVRFKVPADTMSAKLANLPEGFPVARGRIKVRNRRSPGSQSPRRAGRETAPAETPPATAGATETAGRGSRRRPLPSGAAAPPRTDTAPPRGRSSETPASADNTSRHSGPLKNVSCWAPCVRSSVGSRSIVIRRARPCRRRR